MSRQSKSLNPSTSLALEHSLLVSRNQQTFKKCVFWSAFNAIIFSILMLDICNSCSKHIDATTYIEYILCLITCLNLVYFFAKIIVLSLNKNQIAITSDQKRLLGIADNDPNFRIVPDLDSSFFNQSQSHIKQFINQPLNSTPTTPLSSTPMNMTALSWRSNDSLNYSLSSPSWTFHENPQNNSTAVRSFQYRDTSGIDFISDEDDLDKYLKEFETNINVKSLQNQMQQQTNLLSSFWSHPVTKTAKDMSSFLKRCTYQLSSFSNSSSPKGKIEASTATSTNNKSSPQSSSSTELPWINLNINIMQLTQWNENLRKWISQTILERLTTEFDNIDESLEKHGFSDVKIGQVGLYRLRKTAQLQNIVQFIPTLPTLIPFLELTTNQEYLVKRIRELGKGGCMSDFKWNSGTPTDAAIVMHLLASYLDTQLMPLPSSPDVKPFSGCYYVKNKDKLPPLTADSFYIQEVSEQPPHFRIIVGETICEMVKGYNNLFHTILFFLYNVSKREHGMLGRVNLGRAGVNMLWIIEE